MLPLNSLLNSDVTKKIQNERGVLSVNECVFELIWPQYKKFNKNLNWNDMKWSLLTI